MFNAYAETVMCFSCDFNTSTWLTHSNPIRSWGECWRRIDTEKLSFASDDSLFVKETLENPTNVWYTIKFSIWKIGSLFIKFSIKFDF